MLTLQLSESSNFRNPIKAWLGRTAWAVELLLGLQGPMKRTKHSVKTQVNNFQVDDVGRNGAVHSQHPHQYQPIKLFRSYAQRQSQCQEHRVFPAAMLAGCRLWVVISQSTGICCTMWSFLCTFTMRERDI